MAHPRRAKTLNICGPRLRSHRESKGWSREQFDARCQLAHFDISSNTVELIEIQSRWVGDFELVALAGVLEISPLELLTGPQAA